MYDTTEQIPTGMLGGEAAYLLALLWVFGLMGACIVAFVGKRTNERKNRTVGFELEMLKNMHRNSSDANHALAVYLTKLGVQTEYEGYTHRTTDHTKIVTDSSLSSGGIEVVSPPLSNRQRRQWLSGVSKALKGLVGFNRTTGVHMHEGLRKPNQMFGEEGVMSWEQAKMTGVKTAMIYTLFQRAINTVLPASRRNNDYAQSMEFMWDYCEFNDTSYENMYHRIVGNRYWAVNLEPLSRYGTIEFRQHGGSINPVKLDAWAQLLNAIVVRAMTVDNDSLRITYREYRRRNMSLTDMGNFLGLSPKTYLMRYFMSRAEVIQGTHKGNCSECGRNNCAGCDNAESNDWDEVSALHPILQHFSGSSEHFARVFQGYEATCEYADGDAHELSEISFSYRTNPPEQLEVWCHDCETYVNCTIQPVGGFHGLTPVVGAALSLLFGLSPLVVGIALLVGCGIGAIHGAGKPFNNLNRIKRLFVALEARGGQASGFAWKVPNKKDTTMYIKAAKSASALQGNLRRHLTAKTLLAFLHTRYATHGINSDENAHPHFSSGNKVTLVHNGVVSNQDEIYKAIGRKSIGDVDSMALAEALEVGGIEEVVKHATGSMSLIWTDTRDDLGTMHFWTNGGNPLAFGRLDHPKTGAVVVASTMRILKDSMGKRLKSEYECIVGRKYTIQPNGEIVSEDIEGSEATDRSGAMYNWRTYGANYRTTTTKVYGDADNCYVDYVHDEPKGATVDDAESIWDILDIHGGWPSHIGSQGQELHGYDGRLHCGIDPDGTTYQLPQWVSPYTHMTDMLDLLSGKMQEATRPKYDTITSYFGTGLDGYN